MGSASSAASTTLLENGEEINAKQKNTNRLKHPTNNTEPEEGNNALNYACATGPSIDSNNSDANANILSQRTFEETLADSDADIYTDSDSEEEDGVLVTVDFNKFKEETFEGLKESTKNLQDGISLISANGELLRKILEEINFIYNLYFKGENKGFERPLYEKYQTELCELMLQMNFLIVFVKFLQEIPKDADCMAKATEHKQIMMLVMAILHNCTDICDDFAVETAKTKILEVTKSILDASSDKTIIELDGLKTQIIKSCHGIAHNVSMREKNVERLRSLDFTTTVAPYLKSQDEMVRLSALATLANIVTEKECLIIDNHILVVAQLLMLLNMAMESESRRCNGWSCKECALAIRQLARNDANKKLLHELKALQSLIELARSQDKEEQIESILAILALSFDDDIRTAMTKTSELGAVDLLLDLNESSDDHKIKSACEKILWNLKDDLLSSPITSYKRAGGRMQKKNEPATKAGHVMISYQRNDRKYLLTIRDKLKNNGFEVWMDVDRMGGCVYETMANAVENANIFLMCYSRKYKESENCQYESHGEPCCSKEDYATVKQAQAFTNKDVLSAFEPFCSGKELFKSALCQFQERYSAKVSEISEASLRMKISTLYKKERKLVRDKKYAELETFRSEDFAFPKSSKLIAEDGDTDTVHSDKVQILATKTKHVITENRSLKRVIKNFDEENEILSIQVERSERKVEMLLSLLEVINIKWQSVLETQKEKRGLEKECSVWEQKFDNMSDQLNTTLEELELKKQKLSKLNTRNVNKKLKRRDDQIEKQSQTIKDQKNEISLLLCEKEKHESEVERMRREKRNLLVKISRINKKERAVELNTIQISSLKEEIRQKELKIIELEQVNEAIDDPVIQTFYDGKYTNEIRETIMTLISECGVSQSKVNRVMEIVVQNLTGKTLDRLPSTGVKSRLVSEGKRVAQKQVALAMLKDMSELSVSGNCLHQDGTTKSHRHFQSFQVTTAAKRTYSLGLSEVSAGDADTLMEAFKQQIDDLAKAVSNGTDAGTVAKLVCSITSTMSDQGAVNPAFNRQLIELKQNFLPEAFTAWDTLDENVRDEVSKISSYFCKMHIFVNMASEVDKCLSLFESNISSGRNPYAFEWKESGATRLTRTASKALTMQGCDKSGIGSHFSTYLQSIDKANHLISFRGHRFNHLFYAAGATYHHAQDIQNFLNAWSEPNELLKSVSFDIREKATLCGIRALGIVNKLITGPLWRIIESSENILALNPHLHHLQVQLEHLSKDASPLMNGQPVFPGTELHEDDIYHSLFLATGDPVNETYTQMALELICGGMMLILERQAKDQLPGGKFYLPGAEEVERSQNVPTTNTCSERDFGQLDVLMRLKPSASTTAYESCIMWSNNKTSSWLNSLSLDEKDAILNDARINAPSVMLSFRDRQKKLFESKLELLRKRQQQKTDKEAKQYSQKVKLTKKLDSLGGLWLTEEDVFQFKNKVQTNDYKDAIISQLQFRKNVIHSKGPKEKFQQVCKGRSFSVDELERNLIDILRLNAEEETDAETPPALEYVDLDVAKGKFSEAKNTLAQKIREGRNKIRVQQQAVLLPQVTADPNLLIGKKFRHKCRDPETNEVSWYSGMVLKILSEKGRKTEYIVKYDDDDDEWRMPLIIDMEKGDLILS